MLRLFLPFCCDRQLPPPRPRCRPTRPALEPLEDRSLPATAFLQTNLVSDLAGVAQVMDTNLRNPWGVVVNPSGDFWVANAASGTATLYHGDVNGSPVGQDSPVVTIPPAPGHTQSAPTGQVLNLTQDFKVNGPAGMAPALFIYAGLDGGITAEPGPGGYLGGFPAQAQLVASTPGATYTGLAIASNATGNFLVATNSATAKIDVFDKNFMPATLAGNFTDPNLPTGLRPFNVANINGTLFVTYNSRTNRLQGGLIDKFDTNGNFLGRFADGSNLVAPWAVTMAPANFGDFGGDLLVGNFGDGHINAYNPSTGAFLGQLMGSNGQPLAIERLWSLTVGNGTSAGDTGKIYFASGLNQEKDGVFGSLRPMTSTERFVGQLYNDLLGRPVDAAGLAFWTGLLKQGTTRLQVVSSIESSGEYRSEQVRNLYSQFLHRGVDSAGMGFFTGVLASGGTVEQVASMIAGSQEYFQARGGGTTNGFLTALYQDALGRGVDANGMAAFTAAMQAGATPGQVAAVIFASPEFIADSIRADYQNFLHRNADNGGLAFFTQALQQGARDEQVIALIVAADEYFARL
jgi:uncharacterized protein (TIGR03118 family)